MLAVAHLTCSSLTMLQPLTKRGGVICRHELSYSYLATSNLYLQSCFVSPCDLCHLTPVLWPSPCTIPYVYSVLLTSLNIADMQQLRFVFKRKEYEHGLGASELKRYNIIHDMMMYVRLHADSKHGP